MNSSKCPTQSLSVCLCKVPVNLSSVNFIIPNVAIVKFRLFELSPYCSGFSRFVSCHFLQNSAKICFVINFLSSLMLLQPTWQKIRTILFTIKFLVDKVNSCYTTKLIIETTM